jgi:hypothetical protein
MDIGLAFWIIMLILLFVGWRYNSVAPNAWGYGFSGVIWFLFFLVGWKVFGFPIHG